MTMFGQNTLTATEIVENTISVEKRKMRREQFKVEYPDYVPVFIKYYDSDSIFRNILHKDLPFMKLLFIVRQRRMICPTLGLMSLIELERDEETGRVNCIQIPSSQTIGALAESFLHRDGFMYISITTESVFG